MMKKITKITSQVIPLTMNDVDTDLIIPAQYLTKVSQSGYGEHVFQRLREQDPNFVFNQAKYQQAKILLTQQNFGCGSSREHAVWALLEAGIEAIIAVSFADIFFNNAAKNGLLLIRQPETTITRLLKQAEQTELSLTIDVVKQQIINDAETFSLTLLPFHQHCFVNGVDELDYLLAYAEKIKQHKQQQAYFVESC